MWFLTITDDKRKRFSKRFSYLALCILFNYRGAIGLKIFFSHSRSFNHLLWRNSNSLHDNSELVSFTISWKNRPSKIKFSKHAAKGPHINLATIIKSHDYFRTTIKPTLNVWINCTRLVTCTTKIYNFDATPVSLPKQHIFRFEVTMNNFLLLYIKQRQKDLHGNSSDQG